MNTPGVGQGGCERMMAIKTENRPKISFSKKIFKKNIPSSRVVTVVDEKQCTEEERKSQC